VAITIALGVGANTATFSLVNGFLIRPLPVPDPNQLTALAIQEKNSPLGAIGFSYPEFAAFRQQAAPSCEVFGQALAGSPGLTADDRTDAVAMTGVTSNYFSGLGVKPAFGRLILPGEGETPGERPVLVLGYSFWRKRFGSNPRVVGKQVQIDGKPVEIIGVAPKGFHGSLSPFEMDVYAPLSTVFSSSSGGNFWADRNVRLILAMGRLKPKVSLAKAQSLFDVISQRQAQEYPASDKGFSVRVLPERLSRPIPYATSSFFLISALFMVLSAIVLLANIPIAENISFSGYNCKQKNPGNATAQCDAKYSPAAGGVLTDEWGMYTGYTPSTCGQNITDHWDWCGPAGSNPPAPNPGIPFGSLIGWAHTSSVDINGYVNPPTLIPKGTVFSP
jgi:hypothetical protein